VGTKGPGSYLFVTAEGNVLLNTGMPSSGPMIVESVRKLGFKPEDIKLITLTVKDVRLYRPRNEVLDGTWKFPEPVPAK
jgi:hypothetical protein